MELLSWYDQKGDRSFTTEEQTEEEQTEQLQERTKRLADRLRELGEDPDQI
jgi:hypothetical protein